MDTRTLIKLSGTVLALSPVFVIVFAHLIARILRGYVSIGQQEATLPTSWEEATAMFSTAGSGFFIYDFGGATTRLEHLTGLILAGQSVLLMTALALLSILGLYAWQVFERGLRSLTLMLAYTQDGYRPSWFDHSPALGAA